MERMMEQPVSQEMSLQRAESPLIMPTMFVGQKEIEQSVEDFYAGRSADEMNAELARTRTSFPVLINEEQDALETTVVGGPKTGKTTLMELAGRDLHFPVVDAGLYFRMVAHWLAERGYRGGDVPMDLTRQLEAEMQAMEVSFGRPWQGLDQSIVLGGERLAYGDLGAVERDVAVGASQDPRIYRLVMDALKDRVMRENGPALVGGRSLNQEFEQAMARFYVEGQGGFQSQNRAAERGRTWETDNPQKDPRLLRLYNPQQETQPGSLAARAMVMILAQRSEARLSEDQRYALRDGAMTLVTGEPAKAAEVEWALAHPDAILQMRGQTVLPYEYRQELWAAVGAKAMHARAKFGDPRLMVESTSLFIPSLYQVGVPNEVVEYYSKHNFAALQRLLAHDEVSAAMVTVQAVADSRGRVSMAEALIDGQLLRNGVGGAGFGFDPHFRPAGQEATFGQMPAEQKYSYSPRSLATLQLGFA